MCFSKLLFRAEIILAYSAYRAGKILGELIPRRAGSDTVIGIADFGVISPAAHIAYVFHKINSYLDLFKGKPKSSRLVPFFGGIRAVYIIIYKISPQGKSLIWLTFDFRQFFP